jgi:hypothetical protein
MHPRIIATALFLSFSLSGWAQNPACKLTDKKAECAKDQTAEPKERTLERRRAVPAVIPQSPALSPPVTVQRPQPSIQIPQTTSQAPTVAAPSAITSCDSGGCWDGGVGRYNNANGNVFINNAGKTCHQIGVTMQCF